MSSFLRINVLLVCAMTLWAQVSANKGQVSGVVFDQNEAVIQNAKVQLRNVATGAQRETSSDSAGRYQFLAVDPGSYTLTVEAPGFANAVFEGVIVNVGSSVSLPVTMQVGATATTVEVGATLVSLDLPAPAQTVNETAIRDLPINGRRFQDFAALSPGVLLDPERGAVSFLGQRAINSNIMIDGTDYNNPFFGGIRGGERSNFIFTVPQSSIQEFQTVTAGYAAEYGRSTGGVLNTITKSGGNDYHGDGFYQVRHKEMSALTPFKTQNLETLQQFGGSLGGPIQRDRLFWFAAVERQQVKFPRSVLFATLANVTPNENTREAYDLFKSFEGPLPGTNNGTTAMGRMDYQMTNGSRLTFRYNWSDATAENAVTTGTALPVLLNEARSNQGVEKNGTHSGVMQWTQILSPNLVNDLRFSGTYERRPRESNSSLPTVNVRAIGLYGARSFLPTIQDDTRYQINNGTSLIAGAHTFKFGGDYNYLRTFQTFGFNQFGAYTINVTDISQLLEIMSVGGPTPNRFDHPQVQYSRQIGNLLAAFNMHQIAFYAQDAWKVNRKFTLNLGFRWEGQVNPTPEATNTNLVNLVKSVTFPNGYRLDPTTIKNSLNQWMPRLGFSYTPFNSNRTVIRGHAGMFYASTPMLLFAGAINNFRAVPGDVSLNLPRSGSTIYRDFLAVGVDLNRFSLDKLPILTIEQMQQAAAGGGAAVDPFRGARLTAMAPDFVNPRSWQTGIGFDQELASRLVVGAQFNYINTVNLQRNVDVNLPLPQINPADRAQRPNFGQVGAFRIPRPIPTLDRITLRSSSARSMYRGGTFQAQYRGKKFQAGAFYTLSEMFSDDDNERTATSLFYQNPFNFRDEYSYGRLDARHQFTSNAVYQLPWGFSVSGIFRANSGRPIDASAGADLNGDGNLNSPSFALGTSDRPYSAPGVSFRRNAFRNRGFKVVDMRVLKAFRFNERSRLEFSAEMFNLFNFDNIAFDGNALNYGPGIDSATGNVLPARDTFMRLKLADGSYDRVNIQQGSPFQAQFGLRFFF